MLNLLMEHQFRTKANLFWNSEVTEFTREEEEKGIRESINNKFIDENNENFAFKIDEDMNKWRDGLIRHLNANLKWLPDDHETVRSIKGLE
ncbi:MAG: hypothetical protein FWE34_02820 [Defluviitaleaceae bacterium]|nr:hypothetical protein [Defluviitaleaceae bacterium]